MEVLIEKYRGYEIRFDTSKEKFVTDTGNEGAEKPSFASAKKQIDEYVKVNNGFVPFKVIKKSYSGSYAKEIEIVGLRKDGFSILDENGKMVKLSDYGDYAVCSIEDAEITTELRAIDLWDKEMDAIQRKINGINDSIKEKLSKFPNIKDKFKEYQQ